jgi:cytochrome c-type biogenesis protein
LKGVAEVTPRPDRWRLGWWLVAAAVAVGTTAALTWWWQGRSAGAPLGPQAAVRPAAVDVGSMPVDGLAVAAVHVDNLGGAPLRIVGISTSCGCTSAEARETVIAAGGSTTLTVTIDHALMPTAGEFLHAVFLATDDPERPEVIIEVRGVGTDDGAAEGLGTEEPQGAVVAGALALSGAGVEVFFNDACADCLEYINDSLLPTLAAHGFGEASLFDYLKDRAQRAELNRRNSELGIPFELQSHLVTFVGDGLVLAGHIPAEMIVEALTRVPPGARLLVYQDRMPEMGQRVSEYQVWDFRGEALLQPIETPLVQALSGLDLRAAGPGAGRTERLGAARLLPLVLGAGLLDGVNPCAIAVLLLSLAVLFTLQRTRRQVLLTGGVYVGMIFVAYLGIGLGLFGAIVISGEQHLLARIGSWLLVGLGLVNVKDYFWYGRGFSLSVPKVGHEAIKAWLKRATLPSAAVAGFLVGLCTFPCTGGIYVAILGLLSTQTTYLEGLSYLIAYNVMFVLPLVGLLLVLGNRRSVGALARWQAERKRAVKLASGLVMIALGAGLLVWFV